jgi:hypothetical protein
MAPFYANGHLFICTCSQDSIVKATFIKGLIFV